MFKQMFISYNYYVVGHCFAVFIFLLEVQNTFNL